MSFYEAGFIAWIEKTANPSASCRRASTKLVEGATCRRRTQLAFELPSCTPDFFPKSEAPILWVPPWSESLFPAVYILGAPVMSRLRPILLTTVVALL